MADIGIKPEEVGSILTDIISRVESEIIEASVDTKNIIIDAIDNSAGDFVTSLTENITKEADTICDIGELLIAIANYIQSATDEFAAVDQSHHTSKV